MADGPNHSRWRRIALRGFVIVAALYGLLLIPEASPPPPKGAGQQPFVWNRDAFWSSLETKFLEARKLAATERQARFDEALGRVQHTLDFIGSNIFSLELGNAFTFVDRQRRMRSGYSWFRVDLLFFHRRLRCLLMIDPKIVG